MATAEPHRQCSLGDCFEDLYCKTYCRKHYGRFSAYGNPRGTGHHKWLDRIVTWAGAHQRVQRLWGKAKQYPCVECGERAMDWAYDGTDPAEMYGPDHNFSYMRYSRFPEFYMPMCRKCHSGKDQRNAYFELREYRLWKNYTGNTLADIDTGFAFHAAITALQAGQDIAARLKDVVPPDLLSAALDKIDSAILDLEGMRDRWRQAQDA